MWKYKCGFIKRLSPLLKTSIFFGPARDFLIRILWPSSAKMKTDERLFLLKFFYITLYIHIMNLLKVSIKKHIFSNFQGFKVALNFLYDPNCTLKTNGWIYGCFEPVFIEKEGNVCFQDKTSNSNSYILCKKALSRSGCFVDYLNAKSNFLNALNLMASSDRGNLLRGIENCLGVWYNFCNFFSWFQPLQLFNFYNF